MADAVQKQLGTDEAAALGFEERLGLLVDTEWTAAIVDERRLLANMMRDRRVLSVDRQGVDRGTPPQECR